MTKLRLTKDDMVVDYELSVNKPEGILLQVGEEYLKLTENIYESNEGTKLKITKEGIDYYPFVRPAEDIKLIYKMSGDTGKLLVTPLNKTFSKEYSYEIDWGDGSEKETATIYSSNVTKSHTYTDGLEEHIITVTTLNPDYEDFWYPISFNNNTNLIEVLNFNGEYLGVDDQNGIGYTLFYGCTNLTKLSSNFTLPQSLTSVGDHFCYNMFYNCTSLTHLPDDFNLPQGLTSVGSGFCYSQFHNCTSLTHLPDNFNLPQSLTGVGNHFCYNMFYSCTSLTHLPNNFTLPQKLTSVGDNFCRSILYNCTSLTHLPDNFNLPQGLISISNNFCQNMFYSCTSLTHLPDNFNLPQGSITVYGVQFCASMFYSCTSLTHLPNNFNLTQNLTIVTSSSIAGYYFYMFYNCSSLTHLPEGFINPNYIYDCYRRFGENMFASTLIPRGTNDFPDCCW